MSHYIEYYNNQAGGGLIEKYNRFGKMYVGSPYQQGHGIGAFLGGLFRRVMPFLSRAARTVGKEALHAGWNVLGDVTSRQVPLKEAMEKRLTESGLRLKRKASDKLEQIMRGSGYKRQRIRRITHKTTKRGRVKKRSVIKKKKPTKKANKKISKKKKKTCHKLVKNKRDVYDIFN